MNECRWVGNSPTVRLLALTPALVLLPAESLGSVGQGKNMAPASGQAPQPCSLQPLHATPAASHSVWTSLLSGLSRALGPWWRQQHGSLEEK